MNAHEPSRILKLSTLTKLGACKEQRDLFRETFGTSVAVTRALCISHASLFDWVWASEHLLSPSAWATYEQARASAWATYMQATAPAWATYMPATAAAWTTYEQATAPAWTTYEQATAAAFADAFIGDVQA